MPCWPAGLDQSELLRPSFSFFRLSMSQSGSPSWAGCSACWGWPPPKAVSATETGGSIVRSELLLGTCHLLGGSQQRDTDATLGISRGPRAPGFCGRTRAQPGDAPSRLSRAHCLRRPANNAPRRLPSSRLMVRAPDARFFRDIVRRPANDARFCLMMRVERGLSFLLH